MKLTWIDNRTDVTVRDDLRIRYNTKRKRLAEASQQLYHDDREEHEGHLFGDCWRVSARVKVAKEMGTEFNTRLGLTTRSGWLAW